MIPRFKGGGAKEQTVTIRGVNSKSLEGSQRYFFQNLGGAYVSFFQYLQKNTQKRHFNEITKQKGIFLNQSGQKI